MNKILNILFLTPVLAGAIAMAEERDPFIPYTWSAPTGADLTASKATDANNPLLEKPISSYTVIGVVISPHEAIAVLKSRDKHEYFASIGDAVGSEGGVIETISSEGITVDISGKIIPMKVSNRFEAQSEEGTNEEAPK